MRRPRDRLAAELIRPPQVFAVPVGEGLPDPSPYHFEKVWNDAHDNKPGGGLWTSTYTRPWWSSWVRFAADTGVRGGAFDAWRIFLLRPRSNVRLWTIGSRADLERLLEEYPITECWCPKCQMGLTENLMQLDPHAARLLLRAPIDFERLTADGWDGVWLTDDGRAACHHVDYRPSGDWGPDLYGWDAECTLWLRWAFDKVEYVGIVTAAQVQERANAFRADVLGRVRAEIERGLKSGDLTEDQEATAALAISFLESLEKEDGG